MRARTAVARVSHGPTSVRGCMIFGLFCRQDV